MILNHSGFLLIRNFRELSMSSQMHFIEIQISLLFLDFKNLKNSLLKPKPEIKKPIVFP